MATTSNPSSISKTLLTKSFCIGSPTLPTTLFLRRATTGSPPRPLPLVKCNSNSSREREPRASNNSNNNLKDALSGLVDKQVEELLSRDENRVLLDGLEKASQRVEKAKLELAEIERQELEARELRNYINQLETKAAEIAECQQEILEARAMIEDAEQSLSLGAVGDGEGNASETEGVSKDEERLESIKAASISASVGTLAALPIYFTQVTSIDQLILPSGITFISCALFGVTYRYVIRRNLDDSHLKSGAVAAFGFIKGLGMLAAGPPLELNLESFLSHAYSSAVYIAENFLIFAFAAVSLDFCFKTRLLSPFPKKMPASRTNIE